jgi:peptidoglycan/LPS O-acetylase OafA/YrhL
VNVGTARGVGFRPDIQGLRASAVLAVALDHAGVLHVGGGYVGVDVFFVISRAAITDRWAYSTYRPQALRAERHRAGHALPPRPRA